MSDLVIRTLKNSGCKLKLQSETKTEQIILKISGDWNDGDCLHGTENRTVASFLKLWPTLQKFWQSEYNIGELREMKDDEDENALFEAGFTPKEVEQLDELCPGGAPDGCQVHSLDVSAIYQDELGCTYEIN